MADKGSVGLIAITGYSRAGKDTLAALLHPPGRRDESLNTKFSEHLKSTCRVLGWDGKKDKKGLLLLQEVAKSARLYNPDIFTEAWASELLHWSYTEEGLTLFTVDDLRYPNENELMKQLNAYQVRIVGRGKKVEPPPGGVSADEFVDDLHVDEEFDNSGDKGLLEPYAKGLVDKVQFLSWKEWDKLLGEFLNRNMV